MLEKKQDRSVEIRVGQKRGGYQECPNARLRNGQFEGAERHNTNMHQTHPSPKHHAQ
jgi:hypothetical protein